MATLPLYKNMLLKSKWYLSRHVNNCAIVDKTIAVRAVSTVMGFCIGPGSLMGTTGFKWAGRDPTDDCSMLWLGSWGLTSFSRAALACLWVFLLSILSQYLTTAQDCQLQQSKVFAKCREARTILQLNSRNNDAIFYDPELGDGCRNSKLLQEQDVQMATVSTVERVTSHVCPMSVKVGNWTHLADAMMRGLRVLVAYLLMLVVMTYDLTLISSIVVGFMTGFFVFGKDTAKVPVSADPCCS